MHRSLVRDLCLKLGAILLTGDFNKGDERELPLSDTEDQRRISLLKTTFDHAATLSKVTSVLNVADSQNA